MKPTRRKRALLQWMMVGAAFLGFAANGQTAPALSVPPAEQVRRDLTRVQILQSELTAENAAIIKAQQRYSERMHVGDRVGVSEAQAAVRQHLANVVALRREIERVPAPSRAARAVMLRSGPGSSYGGLNHSAAPAAANAWGMYQGLPATLADGAPATTQPLPAAPAWDLYARSRLKPAPVPVPTQQRETIEVGAREPPAAPYRVYREPNAHTQ
jgi:hypothetical protein